MTADYDFSPAVPDGNLFSVAKQWFENGHRIVFAIVIESSDLRRVRWAVSC